ncbi:MAG: HAMP domain-containing protein [Cyanobium sp.]
MTTVRRHRPPWRLTNALVFATSLQLTLLALGIGTISTLNNRRSLDALAGALGQSISEKVRRELDRLLEAPRLINQLNGEAIENGELDPENFTQLRRTFQSQMRLFPVGYINYGNEEGEYLGLERLDNGSLHLNLMERSLGSRRQLVFDLGPSGPGSTPVQVFDDIGTAREEAWYRETVQRGLPTWSSIYQWDDKPEVLSISYNQPVRDRGGRLRGVIGVDLILSQLNTKLQAIWGQRPGVLLIVERDGRLVASSDGRTLAPGPAGQPPRRLRFDQSPDPRVQQAGVLLLRQAVAGRLPARPQRHTHAGSYLEVIPWADRYGLDWLVLVLLPQASLADAIQPHGWLPLVLYLLALSLAILVSARLTRWILRPLRRVSDSATQLADTVRRSPGETLSFQTALPPSSAIEIQNLGRAITTLVNSLNGLVTAQRRSGQRLLREVQRKERALELSRQSQQRAEASSKARQSYLAHLHQEIFAPLSSVQGTTRLALAEPGSGPVHRHLRAIEGATRELLELFALLEDSIDPAALPGDELEPDEEPFSLEQLLQEVSDLVAPQAQRRDRTLTFAIAPGTVDLLVGDGRRLRQVVLQVLSAAIRRGGAGEVALSAATGQEGSGDDRRLRLQLTLHNPAPAAEPGGGLALAISRGLLEAMGGRLEEGPANGGEAAITCWVPVRAAGPLRSSLPPAPMGAVLVVGALARGEWQRLAALLAPLGLVPRERPCGAGAWALVVAEAADDPRASRARVEDLRRELGGQVPIALLVRRVHRQAYGAESQPPWDALLELPLHGPRLRAALAPLFESAGG